MIFRFFAIGLALGLFALPALAQQTIQLIPGNESYQLHPQLEVLVDENCSITPGKVLQNTGFRPYAEQKGAFGDAKGFWVRFTLAPPNPGDLQYYLNTLYFDSVEVYQLKENRLEFLEKSGFLLRPARHAIQVYRTNLATLQLSPAAPSTFYLRLFANSKSARFLTALSYSVGFDLYTYAGVQQTFFNLRDHSFMVAGVLLIMFFFNLLLAFKGREKVYYWLAAYNLIFCLNCLNAFAYTDSSGLFGNRFIIEVLHFQIPAFLVFTYGWFTLYFLELKKYFPWISRTIMVLATSMLSIPILHVLGQYYLAMTVVIGIAIPGFILVIYALVTKYRRGYKHAGTNYYVAGSFLLGVFFINYLFGLLNESSDFYRNEFWVLLAAVGELMIFTYASVQKFTRAQRSVLTLEKRKDLLIQQQEEMKEALAEKSKVLVAKTSQELSKHQKQKEILALLHQVVLLVGTNAGVPLKKAIQKIEKLSYDESFEEEFLIHFNGVHVGFSERLYDLHPNLSINNIRLCAYLRMNLTSLEISQLQGVEKSSINQARYRLRKKMNLDNETDLVAYLASI